MRGAGQKLVLAVASGGGHWQQLLRLRPAFEFDIPVIVMPRLAHAGEHRNDQLRTLLDLLRRTIKALE